jgi:hypothetical protein
LCCFLLCAWNYVPWHSDGVLSFQVHEFRHG